MSVYFLILIAVVIFICIALNNISAKVGVPVLLAFILLGIAFGNNGLFPVRINDYESVENICSIALIFIMFYGGFGTSWSAARCVSVEAGLMASLGVFLTAGVTGVLCHFLLHWGWLESLLLGSVLSSTDAASVFSILRSKRLGLKNNSAPILEVESGSNDPCSYMLTVVMLSLMQTSVSAGHVAWMVFSQIVFGAAFGVGIAFGAKYLLKRITFSPGFDSMFIFAVAVFSYAIPQIVGGNGYLSTYIVGIILGNSTFADRKKLIHFFDGFTSLMQVLIFFMLGLLAHPAALGKAVVPALVTFAVMFFVSRPLSVAAILTPFRKYGLRQQAFLSFSGLRGASSIVFAIMATVGNQALENDIFNIVFCIVLLSISIQGTLIPAVAKRLDMIDKDSDVMKTFSDFSEETTMQFSEITVTKESRWNGSTVKEIGVPKNLLLCTIVRRDGSSVVPTGHTLICEGDRIVLCTKAASDDKYMKIAQHELPAGHKFVGRTIKELPYSRHRIVLIRRGNEELIPHGSTVLQAGDVLFINRSEEQKD